MSLAAVKAQASIVYRATLEDLPALAPLIHDAHRRIQDPWGAQRSLQLLPVALAFPTTYLWVIEGLDGPYGYCWTEIMLVVGQEMHVHELYVRPGRSREGLALWKRVERLAREQKCTAIVGLVWRRSAPRAFRKYGFKPVAALIRKEL